MSDDDLKKNCFCMSCDECPFYKSIVLCAAATHFNEYDFHSDMSFVDIIDKVKEELKCFEGDSDEKFK